MKISPIPLASALALALAVQAQAQTAPANAGLSAVGRAPRLCAFTAPVATDGRLENFQTLQGAVLRVQELTDSQSLTTRAAAAEVSLEATCNFPHRLRLESENNGLWREGAASGQVGFAVAVPYRASVSWGELDRRLEADASGRRPQALVAPVAAPTAGELTLHLEIEPGATNTTTNAPLLAGIYSDVIRLTVEPQ